MHGYLTRSGLDQVVSRLGISQGRAVDKGQLSGFARCQGGAWTIQISGDDASQRQLFTLAHELGHIRLRGQTDRPMHRMDEEGWANRFAAALLMPEDLLIADYGDSSPSLAAAIMLAQRAAVSMSASFLRLREVLGWKFGLLVFQLRDDRWLISSSIGMNRAALMVIKTAPTLSARLEYQSRKPTLTTLPFVFDGSPSEVETEVFGTSRFRWAMVPTWLGAAPDNLRSPRGH